MNVSLHSEIRTRDRTYLRGTTKSLTPGRFALRRHQQKIDAPQQMTWIGVCFKIPLTRFEKLQKNNLNSFNKKYLFFF